MASKVTMPQLGLTMSKGLITEWKKHEGDAVKRGDPLFSVENDKAVIDVDSQADGILAKILVAEMVTVPVGAVVAMIAAAGESFELPPAPVVAPVAAKDSTPTLPQAKPLPQAATTSAIAEKPPVATTRRADGFMLASPLARSTADSLGLRLADFKGSGPEGAVLARDLPASPATDATAPAPAKGMAFPAAADYVDIDQTRIQRIAAQRMAESWATIPQFTLYGEADAAAILGMAQRFKTSGDPVSLTVIVAKLLAHAVDRHPLLNGSWMGEGKVRTYRNVNVNIAVDTEDGLAVPVLRNCSSRGFIPLGIEMKALAGKAKAKALSPEDYEGGTITLSNLGMFGIKRFRAIVNPPQAAILAVGSVEDRVSLGSDGYESRKVMEYSITADHRVVDGAYAARFMATLRAMLEDPSLVLDL